MLGGSELHFKRALAGQRQLVSLAGVIVTAWNPPRHPETRMAHIAEKDKRFLRNAALVGLAAFVVLNPKGAAMAAGGAVLVAGALVWGIRSLQG
jgi:hypothetical protein